ncbi:hypothetical protein QE361_003496 [Sphingomonas sp. SORGH_AS802]|nr:hypothetical protein [Sphingomonas sp. SORGH_AS_0438]MDR6136489.1 hypothetical protein [Sphingomonas sp. SORGH_AS_0802]
MEWPVGDLNVIRGQHRALAWFDSAIRRVAEPARRHVDRGGTHRPGHLAAGMKGIARQNSTAARVNMSPCSTSDASSNERGRAEAVSPSHHHRARARRPASCHRCRSRKIVMDAPTLLAISRTGLPSRAIALALVKSNTLSQPKPVRKPALVYRSRSICWTIGRMSHARDRLAGAASVPLLIATSRIISPSPTPTCAAVGNWGERLQIRRARTPAPARSGSHSRSPDRPRYRHTIPHYWRK